MLTSHPRSQPHSATQILSVDDDDAADVIFPPSRGTSAAIALNNRDPPTPGSSSAKAATVIDLSDEPDDGDGDDEEIRVLRFQPTKTRFKRRRSNPLTPGSVPEPGQSSSSDSLTDYPPFVCEICADDKLGYESFPIENCDHIYCSDCVINYIDSKLQENEPTIRCPVPGCKGLLEPDYCRSLLPKHVFARWGKAMCDAVILGSEKIYCPYQDCSALLIDDAHEVLRECHCPHCSRMFCAHCKVAWHVGISCDDFQKLSVDERGSDDVMLRNLALTQNWRRCPSCKFYVDKSVGCSYMKCRCGYAFCYSCGIQALTHAGTCRSCDVLETRSKPKPETKVASESQIIDLDDVCFTPKGILAEEVRALKLFKESMASFLKSAGNFIDLSDDDDEEVRVLDFQPQNTTFGKRKRKKAFSSPSVTEVGESSNSNSKAKQDQTFLCEICVEPKSREESFGIKDCSHSYCTECMIKYVASKLQENITNIRCPVPDCKGLLELEYCRSILPPEVYERWGSALCEALILGSQKFYCPYKDCSGMLIDDAKGVIREAECPNCWRLFCAQCKVPWHAGIECVEFQKLNKNEREKEDIMLRKLAQNKDWKRCPKCRFYVEKSEGCMFMLCRCHTTFCYRCEHVLNSNHNHYCPNCKGR